MRVSLNSEGKATAEEVTASAITNTNLIFTAGQRIKEVLQAAKFQKAYQSKFPAYPIFFPA